MVRAKVMDLFLAPHNDDETLFGAFTILRYKPYVIVCLRGEVQGQRGAPISALQREMETHNALQEFCAYRFIESWDQWEFSDVTPDWPSFAIRLASIAGRFQRCFAPAWEDGGHEQHNEVARIAQEVFGDRYEPYLTYRRGAGRTRGVEVPFEPGWPSRKMRALACYESQIAEPSTAYWFLDDTLREYRP